MTLAPVGRRTGAHFLGIALAIVTLVIGSIIWGLLVWRRGTTPALSVLKMRCVKAGTGARAAFGTMALGDIVGRLVEAVLGWITGLVSLILFPPAPTVGAFTIWWRERLSSTTPRGASTRPLEAVPVPVVTGGDERRGVAELPRRGAP